MTCETDRTAGMRIIGATDVQVNRFVADLQHAGVESVAHVKTNPAKGNGNKPPDLITGRCDPESKVCFAIAARQALKGSRLSCTIYPCGTSRCKS